MIFGTFLPDSRFRLYNVRITILIVGLFALGRGLGVGGITNSVEIAPSRQIGQLLVRHLSDVAPHLSQVRTLAIIEPQSGTRATGLLCVQPLACADHGLG